MTDLPLMIGGALGAVVIVVLLTRQAMRRRKHHKAGAESTLMVRRPRREFYRTFNIASNTYIVVLKTTSVIGANSRRRTRGDNGRHELTTAARTAA